MGVGYARRSGGQGVETSAQRDDPVVSPQVVECFAQIGVPEPDARGKLSGAARREDPVPLIGEEAYQLDSYERLLWPCAGGHWDRF